MKNSKKIIFTTFILLILFIQFSCQKKDDTQNNEFLKKAAVKDSYQKYLLGLWRDLDTQQENILKQAAQKDLVGGITLEEINLMEDKAEQMAKKNLLIWDAPTEKYKITKIGQDVLQKGKDVAEQEFSEDDVLINDQN